MDPHLVKGPRLKDLKGYRCHEIEDLDVTLCKTGQEGRIPYLAMFKYNKELKHYIRNSSDISRRTSHGI